MAMKVGDKAEFRYGDKQNTDARSSKDMPELFELLRNVFGINFTMEEYEDDCFRVERLKILHLQDIGTLKIDNHLCDEILFTAVSVPEKKFQIFQLKLLFLGITILRP